MAYSRFKLRLYRFLRVKPICNFVFRIRFIWFSKILRRLDCYQDEGAVIGQDYSKERVIKGRPSDRILRLIHPLSAIDKMTVESTVLAIGCRFETDLLYLAAYGFDPNKVRGLDMISYSPWVDSGNMHEMEYPDDSWDCILLGWTLAYSDNPLQAAREMMRVTKNGGLIAISVSYYPPEVLRKLQDEYSLVGSTRKRIQTVDEMLSLFGNSVDRVYFHHDVANPDIQGACMVIFSIKKNGAEIPYIESGSLISNPL